MITRIKQKSPLFIKIAFYIALLIILVAGAVAFKTTKNLSKSSDLVVETYMVNVQLEQIFSYLKDAETGQRGFIITNDSLYLEPYIESRESINNSFAELKELTKENDFQQNKLKDLSSLIDKRLNNFERSSSFSINDNLESPKFDPVFFEGKVLMDSIRNKISEMITHEREELSRRQENYQSDALLTPIFLFFLILLSIALVLLAYYKITKDIESLKIYNEELETFKESANQSEIISKHGNWIWDMEEETYTYSDNLYRLLGEQPQSFKPNLDTFMSYVHPDDREKLKNDVEDMMENEHLPFVHFRIIQKSGNIKRFKSYAQVLELDGVKKLIGTTSDVTDEFESFRLLEERNAELERNNKELSAFNHVASHDLQEPLRKIQTFLSRLVDKESDNLSKNGHVYISRIQNAASRMRLLIDDLLQFSRTNKSEKVFETANINLILEGAKQDLAEAISDSDALITSDTFPVMHVIPFQIQQLFSNLISNSIKYQKQDSTPEISIKYHRINAIEEDKLIKPKKEHYHKLTFTDNGIGFKNEYAEKIFVLFNRLHGKSDFSGTGIGLSICKKIVENHKGYIFANGTPDKGAIFEVYLPI